MIARATLTITTCAAAGVLGLTMVASAEEKAETRGDGSALTVWGQQSDTQSEPTSSSTPTAQTESVAITDSVDTWKAYVVCQGVGPSGALGVCSQAYQCEDGTAAILWMLITADSESRSYSVQCPGDPPPTGAEPAAGPTVTPARVREAFERVPLPESDIMIQPEGGETLVNHPTFLRTDAAPFDETVTFFGGRITVVLHIEPTSFLWHHGDGTTATTTDPGSAYDKSMGLDYGHLVFHEYAKATKEVAVSVDTTWAATWTLNGRDMGAVPGTVTKTGIPQSLDVLEARPVLVS